MKHFYIKCWNQAVSCGIPGMKTFLFSIFYRQDSSHYNLLWVIKGGFDEQLGIPKWSSGKESACQCGEHKFDPWVRKKAWSRKRQPPLVFLTEKSHGQRNLVGYNPWDLKELDMAEHTQSSPLC